MKSLNINDLFHFNRYDLYLLLTRQNTTEFEVVIPRFAAKDDENESYMYDEYMFAAFAGQRLEAVSTMFAYNVPPELSFKPFKMEVTIDDFEKFTDTLYFLIHGFTDEWQADIFYRCRRQENKFVGKVLKNKVECKTWGLLHIAFEYMAKFAS